MKKILALFLAGVMLVLFTGCSRGTDLEEVKDEGEIIVGIRNYKPLCYMEDDEWTGFEAEFAKLFAKKLGVDVEFVEIDWTQKYNLLEEYDIDCVWNGLTILPNYQTTVTVSDGYCWSNQILVMKADVVDNYENGYDVRKLKFVAADDTSGDACLEREGYKNITMVKDQKAALDAVKSGKADCAIVDEIYAKEYVGKGEYNTLATGFYYSEEAVAVAFRKDSDLVDEFNDFLSDIKDDELSDLANKYGITLY